MSSSHPLEGFALTVAIPKAMVELYAATYGQDGAVIDGRIAFQVRTEDESTEAVERLTGRSVSAFMSANQTKPGLACELFYLEARRSDETAAGEGVPGS